MVKSESSESVPLAPCPESSTQGGRTSTAAQPVSDKANVPLEKRIGEVFKQLRRDADLTLADLSAGAGVSSAMLSRIENGMATASLRFYSSASASRSASGFPTCSRGSTGRKVRLPAS